MIDFKVQGLAKVDDKKHPWTCEVKNRHVTAAEYSGPKPEGLSTGQKLAIGAAAAVAGAIAVNEMSKHDTASQAGSGAGGAKELQDLVGARAAGGESELQGRGYTYASGSKGGDSSYQQFQIWATHRKAAAFRPSRRPIATQATSGLAPTGRHIAAQGNALGIGRCSSSPERA